MRTSTMKQTTNLVEEQLKKLCLSPNQKKILKEFVKNEGFESAAMTQQPLGQNKKKKKTIDIEKFKTNEITNSNGNRAIVLARKKEAEKVLSRPSANSKQDKKHPMVYLNKNIVDDIVKNIQ